MTSSFGATESGKNLQMMEVQGHAVPSQGILALQEEIAGIYEGRIPVRSSKDLDSGECVVAYVVNERSTQDIIRHPEIYSDTIIGLRETLVRYPNQFIIDYLFMNMRMECSHKTFFRTWKAVFLLAAKSNDPRVLHYFLRNPFYRMPVNSFLFGKEFNFDVFVNSIIDAGAPENLGAIITYLNERQEPGLHIKILRFMKLMKPSSSRNLLKDLTHVVRMEAAKNTKPSIAVSNEKFRSLYPEDRMNPEQSGQYFYHAILSGNFYLAGKLIDMGLHPSGFCGFPKISKAEHAHCLDHIASTYQKNGPIDSHTGEAVRGLIEYYSHLTDNDYVYGRPTAYPGKKYPVSLMPDAVSRLCLYSVAYTGDMDTARFLINETDLVDSSLVKRYGNDLARNLKCTKNIENLYSMIDAGHPSGHLPRYRYADA